MTLKLYNTRTRRKEDFSPIDANNVRMYVCGPTVYDYAHIGNARPAIVFDVLYRLLRHIYGADHVTYVRNITDVDDKINARAAEEGVPIRELTERTVKQYHEDVAALGCLPPDVEPRATEHIEEMKAMIETLVAKGCAYVAEDHVLFHVAAMPDYGKLSRRSLDEMQAGARVEVAPYKRDPMDFVLWKPSKQGEPGWPSPCGIGVPGRPGWHIECSAMSEKHLGKTFDIHGGGIDLVFPHHENEVAQSRCANDTKIMANIWMHNGFLQVEGEKMSKSLGNFFTINDLLQDWPGDVLRFQMLLTHYRQPIDWTATRSVGTRQELQNWAETVAGYANVRNYPAPFQPVIDALSEDLNTPLAITEMRNFFESAKSGTTEQRLQFLSTCRFLGFRNLHKPGYFEFILQGTDIESSVLLQNVDNVKALRMAYANSASDIAIASLKAKIESHNVKIKENRYGEITLIGNKKDSTQKIIALIDARSLARKAKNWAEADRIRDELAAMGVALKDAKDPETGEIVTTWEIAR